MFNLGKKLGFAALLAFGAVSSAQASLVVLDTFDYTPVVNLEVNAGTITDTTDRLDVNALLGDVRYTLDYIAGPLDSSAVSFDMAGDGVLSFSNDDFMMSTLTMLYTALNGTPGGPLDLTGGGAQDAFYFDVLSSDLGFSIEVIVGSAGGMSNLMGNSSAVAALTRTTINFSDFALLAGAGADFAAVDFVTIILTTTSIGSDLSITEFGTIPEPTTLAIFGLGLLGLALSRKKAS